MTHPRQDENMYEPIVGFKLGRAIALPVKERGLFDFDMVLNIKYLINGFMISG